MTLLRVLVGLLVTGALVWVVFLTALLLARPKGLSVRDASAVVPDTVRLLRSVHADPTTPAGARRALRALLVYLALPFDLVPDFLPVIGYADDVIVVALVLRRVLRRIGADSLGRHWPGSPEGLELLVKLLRV